MRCIIRVLLFGHLLLGFPVIISHVVNDFKKCDEFFMETQPPVIPGILSGFYSEKQNLYEMICQRYLNIYRYATLYDTTNRIPVFSAYKYTGKGNFKRKDLNPRWMIESGLEPQNNDMIVPNLRQAINPDYRENSENVNRGHIFPSCHAADIDTARSTFTLTNIVPQKKSFNEGSWARMETTVKQMMEEHCRDKNNNVLAHVLTGAVPGNTKLNGRVNIPSLMWTAFCCKNSVQGWASKAHWALNEDETDSRTIQPVSLEELQTKLSEFWGPKVQLFKEECLTDLIVDINLPPPDDECADNEDKKDNTEHKSRKTTEDQADFTPPMEIPDGLDRIKKRFSQRIELAYRNYCSKCSRYCGIRKISRIPKMSQDFTGLRLQCNTCFSIC